jgi:hypothetical protein
MNIDVEQKTIVPISQVNERLLLALWLIVNVVALTLGMTNFVAMIFISIPLGIAQGAILSLAFGNSWVPWIILEPFIWFCMSYGAPILGGLFLPVVNGNVTSPIYPFFPALTLGFLTGLCEFILLRKHLSNAYWWIPIHALAFGIAGLISPSAFQAQISYDSNFTLISAFIGAFFYSAVTGIGLSWLRRDNTYQEISAR